jgi:quinoprotein glucose dehydrogenase
LSRLAHCVLPVSVALVSAACASAQGAGAPAAVSSAELPAENFDYRGWDAYLGGSESSQYSALSQIDKDNVNQLEVAWSYESGAGQPPQFNPIVADGKMFVLRGDGKIAALDPACD